MHEALQKQTRKVEKAARLLRRDYDVERLHALRVAIRRIRSLLKGCGRRRLRRFRRTWGALARVSNRARDWDVFLEQAEQLLGRPEYERFSATCWAFVQTSRDAVIQMLNSPHWSSHIEEWNAYLVRCAQSAPAGDPSLGGSPGEDRLLASIDKCNAALALAPADSDDEAWHRLRIAVKEARYRAERTAGKPGRLDPGVVVRTCKTLQSALGAWHDCVVQLRLLAVLERDVPEAEALVQLLQPQIERLRVTHLAEVRKGLQHQSVFAAQDRAGRDAARSRD